MYWEKIEGWFTFHRLYQTIVNNSNNNSIFIEIGTWKGKSTVFMAEKIKESNKQIKFYAIDTFEGTNNEHENYDCIQTKTLYEEYLKNIEPVKDIVDPTTNKKIEYKLKGKTKYELCADFKTANKDMNDQDYEWINNRWPHEKGYQCIPREVLNVKDAAVETPAMVEKANLKSAPMK
jgi:hypothetical protein